ncbi:hypothetical protein EAS61_40265 [Bradyrhizobium zhanjiangense]|uniref:Uncharacterized protein n=1 Tax=Bradyrhizobium zhanjiangense TaxID=1325107 RepID=A0A4Q0Q5V7_9BRAD|nr:hypothetical protein EAS61_40265 [Bradyrhizobium zhanjiangense]
MLGLRACGWGLKRIARQLGCSLHTVKGYVVAGRVKAFKLPEPPKRLTALRVGCARGSFGIAAMRMWCARTDLLAEQGWHSAGERCNVLCSPIVRR